MLAAAQSKAKTVIGSGVSKTKTALHRARLAVEITVILLALFVYIDVRTNHLHGEFYQDGLTFGGGTPEHQALNGSLQKLASAVPASAITPVAARVAAQDVPRPAEKPKVRE